MYYFFLGTMILPVTPKQIEFNYGGNNKTYNLINDGEINVIKTAKLTDIKFSVFLPNQKYPFANYLTGYKPASFYLKQLDLLRNNKKPFQFIVVRFSPAGKMLSNTNLKVSLEDFTVGEDAGNGTDVVANITLKQYKSYGTKVVTPSKDNKTATVTENRIATTAPAPTANEAYTVKSGDNLWNICKAKYGDGSLCYKVAELNNIKNPNLISTNQKLTLPPKNEVK